MKANWRRSQAAPHLGRVAFEKYKVRASLEEELTKKAQEFDDRRWEEGIQYNKVRGEISFDA